MSPWTELVRAYLRTRRYTLEAGTTLVYYRHVLLALSDHLGGLGVPLTADAAVLGATVADWVGTRRWATSTRVTNLGIIRPFLDWAGRRGAIAPGAAEDIPMPRRPDPLPRALPRDQILRLLAAVPDRRGL